MKTFSCIVLTLIFSLSSLHADEKASPSMNLSPSSKEQSLTPTERYLQDFPVDKLLNEISYSYFGAHLTFFLNIVANETREGFFGYHGHSQQYRIFQDILRAVFEETLAYQIPADFQFLRIPGDPLYELKNTKESFYKMFDRKQANTALKNIIIDDLFLSAFNTQFNLKLSSNSLTDTQKAIIWDVFMNFMEKLDVLSKEEYYTQDDSLTPNILQAPTNNQLNYFSLQTQDESNIIDEMGTETVKKNGIREKLATIMQAYDAKTSASPQINALGAESSSTLLELFSALLKKNSKVPNTKTLSDWTKKNFNFRALLDRAYSATYGPNVDLLERYFFPYNDSTREQQTRLVAMNIPLFGNFHRWDESSFIIFNNNSSIEAGESKAIPQLEEFFTKIGLKSTLVKELEKIAINELKANNVKSGCILQFFDASGNLAKNVDKSVYVSHSWGIPYKQVQPSQVVSGEYPLRNHTMDLQFRLVTSSYTTLNPYGFVRMARHEKLDPEVSQQIIIKMKEALKKNPANSKKKEAYKKTLNKTWGLSK